MTEFLYSNQANTFVLRIWHDQAASGRSWYGRIEDLHTGQHIAFQDLERLADFIRMACAIEDNERQDCTPGG